MKSLIVVFFLTMLLCAGISAQTTEFTFQGSLRDGASAANGNFDFEFRLYDSLSGGTQSPTVVTRNNIAISNGIFSVTLDFTSQLAGAFPGADRYLEIRVRNAGGGSYTLLAPRQKVTGEPYSQKSLNSDSATTATNSLQLGGISAGQYLTTANGNTAFVQNTTTEQATSNFNISGNGTAGGTIRANILRSDSTFNINNTPVLSIEGVSNVFAGVSAGQANGAGSFNAFLGNQAGVSNISASNNTFVGGLSGSATTTGGSNSFFGKNAGNANTSGSNNTIIGSGANVGVNNLTFASAIGAGSVVNTASTVVLGRSADVVRVPGDLTVVGTSTTGSLTGTTITAVTVNGTNVNSSGEYRINSNRVLGVPGTNNTFVGRLTGTVNTGSNNSFLGYNAGSDNVAGSDNSFFGSDAGGNTTSGSDNTFIGRNAGDTNTAGTNNTVIGSGADVAKDLFGNSVNFGTAIGAGAIVGTSNSLVLGRSIDSVRIPGQLNVTGDVTVGNLLVVQGDAGIVGSWQIGTLGAAGATALCRNNSNLISTCSSSLRYKTNINPFSQGLALINKLKPIAFDWKDGGMKDVGFGAEDVAKIDPRFVTYNDKGEVEGVKYDRLSVAFVNAFKEQQSEIEMLKQQVALLKTLVCEKNKDTEICKEKEK